MTHMGDVLTNRARLTPEREALLELETGQRYTYAELNDRAARCAHALLASGVRTGDRVAILAHNGVAHLDLLYGAARIGAVLAPLNWRLTPGELAYILGDMEPAMLLCGAEFGGVLEELRALAPLPPVLALDGAEMRGAAGYEAALAAAPATEPPRPELSGETPLCLLYTSGTTGRPKGAVLPHRQVLWNCINTVISWGLREDDVTPVLTPLFHTGGLFAFLTPIHYVGGRVVLARGFDAEASLRTIVEEGCTVVLGVPTLFRMWEEAPGFADADFARVRFFISGGAPCPPELMERWRRDKGVAFRQGYGLTEAGPNCFSMTDAEAVRKPGSVGRPVMHAAVRLVDPETGRDARAGEAGELWIGGPHVCAGYWRNPEATAASLVDGWFRTGDTVRADAEGFHYIVGRYKDMIKSGGENVYAAEVEAVFREHPGVADAALIGEPDAKWGEVGLMVVVRRPGAACEEGELLRFCGGRLARYKIPRRVVFAAELPYSSYGKVVKAELRRTYLAPAADAR